ncbi:MAG: methyltransferase domain-containing protein [Pseudomonadota bacterium]
MTEPNHTQEYDDQLMTLLETLWGEGFMSPGGTDEVDRYLDGIDLSGSTVLDIGCGLGGVDLHLINHHHAENVVGIDVDQGLIDRCNELAKKYNLGTRAKFLCVNPGPLEFGDSGFSVVTSKDSIIHIPDKRALAEDIFRVLEPGGWFAASDWLAGYDDNPSSAMQEYLEAEGLDFGLATASIYQQALEDAGFIDVAVVDRNDWYRQQARVEKERLRGDLYASLCAEVGNEFVDHEIEVWEKMILALDEGQLRPTHLRGKKPA